MQVRSPLGAAEVVIDLPIDFREIPLDEGLETRTAEQLMLTEDMGLTDATQREAFALYLEALSVRLGDDNVAGAAFCAVRLNGHPSTATLTIAVHHTHTHDPGVAVLGAAETLQRDGHGRVEVTRLGETPVVRSVSNRGVGNDDEALREMTVLVPLTGTEQAVLVTLSTPCLVDWDTYVGVLETACRSVRIAAIGAATRNA